MVVMGHLRDLREKLRESQRDDPQAIAEVSAQTREAILADLDDEQKAAFEETEASVRQKLEQRRAGKRSRRRPASGDAERGHVAEEAGDKAHQGKDQDQEIEPDEGDE
jgi:hypothetical protein